MTEYLTKRNGRWHFVRRIPVEFAHLDKRRDVRLSTKVSVASDPHGIKASRVAERRNRELEAYWHSLVEGKTQEAADRYAEARRRTRTPGFDCAEVGEPTNRSIAERLERIEILLSKGALNDTGTANKYMGHNSKMITAVQLGSNCRIALRTRRMADG